MNRGSDNVILYRNGLINPPAPKVLGRDRPDGTRLSFWTRFRTDFRRFVIAETLVFTVVFCFLHA